MDMEALEGEKFWDDCSLIERVPGRVSGAPVFKNTRLPVSVVVENVDGFRKLDGQSVDEAIASTLACFDVPHGADGIRTVFANREARQHQFRP